MVSILTTHKKKQQLFSNILFIQGATLLRAVSSWSFTVETRVRSQAGSFGIVCGKPGTFTGYFPVISFSLSFYQ
jgi:hypothetical protein